jgi:hypothetical protein
MVSRKLLILVAITCFSAACASSNDAAQSLILSVVPATGSPGDQIQVFGANFDTTAGLNIITLADVSSVADSFDIAPDGSEVLTFEIPAGATVGATTLLVLVNNLPSNGFDFTVTP